MKSVVICGSGRYKLEIRKFAKELKAHDVIVYEPHLFRGDSNWQKMSESLQGYVLMGLTYDHFHKIKIADVIYVYNKDGYSGVSTTLELGYAVALNKVIYAHSEDKSEGCRNILFQSIIKTPEDLIKKLL